MRVSREKINKLAPPWRTHWRPWTMSSSWKTATPFAWKPGDLEKLLAEEARIDAAARQKIESQRRTILEGSQEWDILYRKYYNEEVKKLGI